MAHYKSLQNIIIADVQYLITTSLKSIIQDDMQYIVNRVVTNKNDLLEALNAETFSMLIIDYAQIDFDGYYVLQKIRKEYPCLSILILTNSVTKSELMELNNLDIKNILLKTAARDQLLTAIEATINGKNFYSEEVLENILELTKRNDFDNKAKKQLTCSEIEIVRLIAEGLTTKEIAIKKVNSVHTIMTHRKNIFRKLGLSNSSELIMYAIKTGIIDTIEYYI